MAWLAMGAPPVKVYHEKSIILPDVSRVLACLYEKNIKFDSFTTSLPKSLLRLQASSRAPVPFCDGSTSLEESREICCYIAERYEHHGYQFLLGKDALERSLVEQWLHSEEHAFNPPSRALFCHLAFPVGVEEDGDDIDLHIRKLEEVLEVYEERLSDSRYLAGDKFTLADLVHLPNSHYITSSEFLYLYDSRKNVMRWWDEISNRGSWQQVLSDMKLVEEQHKLEELKKQQQQKVHPRSRDHLIRIDSHQRTSSKPRTILVPPADVSSPRIVTQPVEPLPTDTFLGEAPASSIQSTTADKTSAIEETTLQETPPMSVRSTPTTPKKSYVPVQSTKNFLAIVTSPPTPINDAGDPALLKEQPSDTRRVARTPEEQEANQDGYSVAPPSQTGYPSVIPPPRTRCPSDKDVSKQPRGTAPSPKHKAVQDDNGIVHLRLQALLGSQLNIEVTVTSASKAAASAVPHISNAASEESKVDEEAASTEQPLNARIEHIYPERREEEDSPTETTSFRKRYDEDMQQYLDRLQEVPQSRPLEGAHGGTGEAIQFLDVKKYRVPFEETKGPGSTLPRAKSLGAQDPFQVSKLPALDQKDLGSLSSQRRDAKDARATMSEEKPVSTEWHRDMIKKSESQGYIKVERVSSLYLEKPLVEQDNQEISQIIQPGGKADGSTPKHQQASDAPYTFDGKLRTMEPAKAQTRDDFIAEESYKKDTVDDQKVAPPLLLSKEPISQVQPSGGLPTIDQWQRASAPLKDVTTSSGDDENGMPSIDQKPTPMSQQATPSAVDVNQMAKESGEQRRVQRASPSYPRASSDQHDMTDERVREPTQIQSSTPDSASRPPPRKSDPHTHRFPAPTMRLAPGGHEVGDSDLVSTRDGQISEAAKARHHQVTIHEDVHDANLSTHDVAKEKSEETKFAESTPSSAKPMHTQRPAVSASRHAEVEDTRDRVRKSSDTITDRQKMLERKTGIYGDQTSDRPKEIPPLGQAAAEDTIQSPDSSLDTLKKSRGTFEETKGPGSTLPKELSLGPQYAQRTSRESATSTSDGRNVFSEKPQSDIQDGFGQSEIPAKDWNDLGSLQSHRKGEKETEATTPEENSFSTERVKETRKRSEPTTPRAHSADSQSPVAEEKTSSIYQKKPLVRQDSWEKAQTIPAGEKADGSTPKHQQVFSDEKLTASEPAISKTHDDFSVGEPHGQDTTDERKVAPPLLSSDRTPQAQPPSEQLQYAARHGDLSSTLPTIDQWRRASAPLKDVTASSGDDVMVSPTIDQKPSPMSQRESGEQRVEPPVPIEAKTSDVQRASPAFPGASTAEHATTSDKFAKQSITDERVAKPIQIQAPSPDAHPASQPTKRATPDSQIPEAKFSDSTPSSAKPIYTHQRDVSPSRQTQAKEDRDKGRQIRETIPEREKMVKRKTGTSVEQSSDRQKEIHPSRQAAAEDAPSGEKIQSPDILGTSKKSRGTLEEAKHLGSILPKANSLGSPDAQRSNGESTAATSAERRVVSAKPQSDVQDGFRQSKSPGTNRNGLGSLPSQGKGAKESEATMPEEKPSSTERVRKTLQKSEPQTPRAHPTDFQGPIQEEGTPSIYQRKPQVPQDSWEKAQNIPAGEKADGSTPKHQQASDAPYTFDDKLTASAPAISKTLDDFSEEEPYRQDATDDQKVAPPHLGREPTSQAQPPSEQLHDAAPHGDLSGKLYTIESIEQWRRTSVPLPEETSSTGDDAMTAPSISQKLTPTSQQESGEQRMKPPVPTEEKTSSVHGASPSSPGATVADHATIIDKFAKQSIIDERVGAPKQMPAPSPDIHPASRPTKRATPEGHEIGGIELVGTPDSQISKATKARDDPAIIQEDVRGAILSTHDLDKDAFKETNFADSMPSSAKPVYTQQPYLTPSGQTQVEDDRNNKGRQSSESTPERQKMVKGKTDASREQSSDVQKAIHPSRQAAAEDAPAGEKSVGAAPKHLEVSGAPYIYDNKLSVSQPTRADIRDDHNAEEPYVKYTAEHQNIAPSLLSKEPASEVHPPSEPLQRAIPDGDLPGKSLTIDQWQRASSPLHDQKATPLSQGGAFSSQSVRQMAKQSGDQRLEPSIPVGAETSDIGRAAPSLPEFSTSDHAAIDDKFAKQSNINGRVGEPKETQGPFTAAHPDSAPTKRKTPVHGTDELELVSTPESQILEAAKSSQDPATIYENVHDASLSTLDTTIDGKTATYHASGDELVTRSSHDQQAQPPASIQEQPDDVVHAEQKSALSDQESAHAASPLSPVERMKLDSNGSAAAPPMLFRQQAKPSAPTTLAIPASDAHGVVSKMEDVTPDNRHSGDSGKRLVPSAEEVSHASQAIPGREDMVSLPGSRDSPTSGEEGLAEKKFDPSDQDLVHSAEQPASGEPRKEHTVSSTAELIKAQSTNIGQQGTPDTIEALKSEDTLEPIEQWRRTSAPLPNATASSGDDAMAAPSISQKLKPMSQQESGEQRVEPPVPTEEETSSVQRASPSSPGAAMADHATIIDKFAKESIIDERVRAPKQMPAPRPDTHPASQPTKRAIPEGNEVSDSVQSNGPDTIVDDKFTKQSNMNERVGEPKQTQAPITAVHAGPAPTKRKTPDVHETGNLELVGTPESQILDAAKPPQDPSTIHEDVHDASLSTHDAATDEKTETYHASGDEVVTRSSDTQRTHPPASTQEQPTSEILHDSDSSQYVRTDSLGESELGKPTVADQEAPVPIVGPTSMDPQLDNTLPDDVAHAEQKSALSDQESAHAASTLSPVERMKLDSDDSAAAPPMLFRQQAKPSAPITLAVPASDAQGVVSKIEDVTHDNRHSGDSGKRLVPSAEEVSHASQAIPGREDMVSLPGSRDSPTSDQDLVHSAEQPAFGEPSQEQTVASAAELIKAQSTSIGQQGTADTREAMKSENALDTTPTHGEVRQASSVKPARMASSFPRKEATSATEGPPPPATRDSLHAEDVSSDALGGAHSIKPSTTPDAHGSTPGEAAIAEQKSAPSGQESADAAQLALSVGPRNEEIRDSSPSELISSTEPRKGDAIVSVPDQDKDSKAMPSRQDILSTQLPLGKVQKDVHADDFGKPKPSEPLPSELEVRPLTVVPASTPDTGGTVPYEVSSDEQKFNPSDQDPSEPRNEDTRDSTPSKQKVSSNETRKEDAIVTEPDPKKDSQTTLGLQDELAALSPGTKHSSMKDQKDASGNDLGEVDTSKPLSNVQEVSPPSLDLALTPSPQRGATPDEVAPSEQIFSPSGQDSIRSTQPPSSSEPRNEDIRDSIVAAPDQTKDLQTTLGQQDILSRPVRSVPSSLDTQRRLGKAQQQDVRPTDLGKAKSPKSPSVSPEVMPPEMVPTSAPDTQHDAAPDAPDEQKFTPLGQDSAHSVQSSFSTESTKEDFVAPAADENKELQKILFQHDMTPAVAAKSPFSDDSQDMSGKIQETTPDDSHSDESLPTQKQVSPHKGRTTGPNRNNFEEIITMSPSTQANILDSGSDLAPTHIEGSAGTHFTEPEAQTKPPAASQDVSLDASSEAKSTKQETKTPAGAGGLSSLHSKPGPPQTGEAAPAEQLFAVSDQESSHASKSPSYFESRQEEIQPPKATQAPNGQAPQGSASEQNVPASSLETIGARLPSADQVVEPVTSSAAPSSGPQVTVPGQDSAEPEPPSSTEQTKEDTVVSADHQADDLQKTHQGARIPSPDIAKTTFPGTQDGSRKIQESTPDDSHTDESFPSQEQVYLGGRASEPHEGQTEDPYKTSVAEKATTSPSSQAYSSDSGSNLTPTRNDMHSSIVEGPASSLEHGPQTQHPAETKDVSLNALRKDKSGDEEAKVPKIDLESAPGNPPSAPQPQGQDAQEIQPSKATQAPTDQVPQGSASTQVPANSLETGDWAILPSADQVMAPAISSAAPSRAPQVTEPGQDSAQPVEPHFSTEPAKEGAVAADDQAEDLLKVTHQESRTRFRDIAETTYPATEDASRKIQHTPDGRHTDESLPSQEQRYLGVRASDPSEGQSTNPYRTNVDEKTTTSPSTQAYSSDSVSDLAPTHSDVCSSISEGPAKTSSPEHGVQTQLPAEAKDVSLYAPGKAKSVNQGTKAPTVDLASAPDTQPGSPQPQGQAAPAEQKNSVSVHESAGASKSPSSAEPGKEETNTTAADQTNVPQTSVANQVERPSQDTREAIQESSHDDRMSNSVSQLIVSQEQASRAGKVSEGHTPEVSSAAVDEKTTLLSRQAQTSSTWLDSTPISDVAHLSSDDMPTTSPLKRQEGEPPAAAPEPHAGRASEEPTPEVSSDVDEKTTLMSSQVQTSSTGPDSTLISSDANFSSADVPTGSSLKSQEADPPAATQATHVGRATEPREEQSTDPYRTNVDERTTTSPSNQADSSLSVSDWTLNHSDDRSSIGEGPAKPSSPEHGTQTQLPAEAQDLSLYAPGKAKSVDQETKAPAMDLTSAPDTQYGYPQPQGQASPAEQKNVVSVHESAGASKSPSSTEPRKEETNTTAADETNVPQTRPTPEVSSDVVDEKTLMSRQEQTSSTGLDSTPISDDAHLSSADMPTTSSIKRQEAEPPAATQAPHAGRASEEVSSDFDENTTLMSSHAQTSITGPDLTPTSGDARLSGAGVPHLESMEPSEDRGQQQEPDQAVVESLQGKNKQVEETKAQSAGTDEHEQVEPPENTNLKEDDIKSELEASGDSNKHASGAELLGENMKDASEATEDTPADAQKLDKSDTSLWSSEESKVQQQTEGKIQGGETGAPSSETEQPRGTDLPANSYENNSRQTQAGASEKSVEQSSPGIQNKEPNSSSLGDPTSGAKSGDRDDESQ